MLWPSQNFFLCKSTIQGVPLKLEKTSKGGSGREDKHYLVNNHGAQTSSVGTRETKI